MATAGRASGHRHAADVGEGTDPLDAGDLPIARGSFMKNWRKRKMLEELAANGRIMPA